MIYENVPGGTVKQNQLIVFLKTQIDVDSKDIDFKLQSKEV